MRSPRSPADASSSGAGAARSTRSARRRAASTGSSTPARACARRSASDALGTRDIAVFGDAQANLYALDAATGRLLWKTDVDDFPVGRISGSPTLYNGRIYVGTASGEEASGANPAYECCKFRGSVVAVDAATGKMLWKTYTLDAPKPTKKNAVGTQLWGPSGAPVWSAPAIDAKLNRLYVTTGNNYSDPTTPTSDAFMALDLDSGKILWSRQMTAEGRLYRGVPSARQDQLRRVERTGLRLFVLAHSALPRQRPTDDRRRAEVGHRPCARSRQGR